MTGELEVLLLAYRKHGLDGFEGGHGGNRWSRRVDQVPNLNLRFTGHAVDWRSQTRESEIDTRGFYRRAGGFDRCLGGFNLRFGSLHLRLGSVYLGLGGKIVLRCVIQILLRDGLFF